MKTAFIYTLADPRSGAIRYVGKTNNLYQRFASHLSDSKKGNSRIRNWVSSLLSQELKPVMVAIEEATEENWQQRERYWIANFRLKGCDLCNHTDGGEGLVNPSEATKEKQRANNQKNIATYQTPEFRAKISVVSKAMVRTPEHCQKIRESKLGKPRNEETKAKISKSRRGKTGITPEGYKLITAITAPLLIAANERRKKVIQQLDLDGQLVNAFPSLRECVNSTGIPKGTISNCVRRGNATRGFYFKYQ